MIRYYLDDRMRNTAQAGEQIKYRLFAHIDNCNFWAVEWLQDQSRAQSVVTDLNAGIISELVKEACGPLKEITADEIRDRFASFGDYIIRCVGGFRSYMTWIAPEPEVSGIALNVQLRENSIPPQQKSP